MRLFEHTSSERGLWRGWLKNGQSVEISTSRHGWDFGCGYDLRKGETMLECLRRMERERTFR